MHGHMNVKLVQAFFEKQFNHKVANTCVHTKCAGYVQAQYVSKSGILCLVV